MGILNSAETDARFTFLDLDGWGESVTYKKRTGATRTINAIVMRNLPPEIDASGVTRYPVLAVVSNDATNGIAMSELDSGADKLAVAFRLGQATKDIPLGVPESQDAGMLTFKLYTAAL